MTLPIAQRELSGWGRYPRAICCCVRPERYRDLLQLKDLGAPLIARGHGRCYGDASMPTPNGIVVLMERFDRFLDFDPGSGRVTVETGVSFADLIEVGLPKGWFPSVTPGHSPVSMGGAVAANVHGKNHYTWGSFIDMVESLRLINGEGQLLDLRPGDSLFTATFGGQGLTGIVRDISLQLMPVETGYLKTLHRRTTNLAQTFSQVDEFSRDWPYVVAWFDAIAPGIKLGRGLVDAGRHASLTELPDTLRTHQRWALPAPKGLMVPPLPTRVVRRPLMRQYNRLKWYREQPEWQRLETWWQFFYPLDSLGAWNHLYGPAGFVQYQFSVPTGAGEGLTRRILEAAQGVGCPPLLAVLKRLGPPRQPSSHLDFLQEGWTIALDFPLHNRLMKLLERCDDWVAEASGRIYLTKDSRWRGADREASPADHFQSAARARWGVAQ
jgi:decaprenylphospho-beta-D-ribofuranose 2-oxidase